MLARLKELQQRQQSLNEQLAQNNARQPKDQAGEQPSPESQGQPQQGSQPQPGDQPDAAGSESQQAEAGKTGEPRDDGTEQDDTKNAGGDEKDPRGDENGADGEQPRDADGEESKDGETGAGEQESDADGKDGDQDSSRNGPGDTDQAAAEQTALGEASGEVADQLTEMPLGKSQTGVKDVAGELRRASTFQENAAAAIVSRRLGEATRLGSEGSAAIAEAIHKLEELVFAGQQFGSEAESYPDGYEQLIREYLRAISYE